MCHALVATTSKNTKIPADTMPKRTARALSRCAHGRLKWRCKECGNGYCVHARQKCQCRLCGTGHCVHNSRTDRCPICGTGRCAHGRLRSRCTACLSGDKLRTLATQCGVCGVTQVCRKRSSSKRPSYRQIGAHTTEP